MKLPTSWLLDSKLIALDIMAVKGPCPSAASSYSTIYDHNILSPVFSYYICGCTCAKIVARVRVMF